MSREIRTAYVTGRTVSAKVYSQVPTLIGTVSLSESPPSSGVYAGTFPAAAAGTYDIVFLEASTIIGADTILWDGTAVVTPGTPDLSPVVDAVESAVAALGSNPITVTSPIIDNENLEIVRGDDYLTSDGRALLFQFSGNPSLSGATATLTASPFTPGNCAGFILNRIDDEADSVSFDLPRATTAAMENGRNDYAYRFAVVATLTDGSVCTLAKGRIKLLEPLVDA